MSHQGIVIVGNRIPLSLRDDHYTLTAHAADDGRIIVQAGALELIITNEAQAWEFHRRLGDAIAEACGWTPPEAVLGADLANLDGDAQVRTVLYLFADGAVQWGEWQPLADVNVLPDEAVQTRRRTATKATA